MAAHSGPRLKIDDKGIIFALDHKQSKKNLFNSRDITNYIYSKGYTTGGTKITESDLPDLQGLRKLTPYADESIRMSTQANWQKVYYINQTVDTLPAGKRIIFSAYFYTPKSDSAWNCNGNFGATVGTNYGLGTQYDITPNQWTRLQWTYKNTTGSDISVSNFRIETQATSQWSDGILCYACNPQVEIVDGETNSGTTISASPYCPTSSRTGSYSNLFNPSVYAAHGTASQDSSVSEEYTSDGTFFFFNGEGEGDGSPRGSHLNVINNSQFNSNPTLKPNGITYTWWQNIKDTLRRGLFISATTIDHIEIFNSTSFRTEARLQNGKSFGASGASMVTDAWQHFAIVLDNSVPEARWYQNATLINTTSLINGNGDSDYFNGTGNFQIGISTGTSDFFYAQSFHGYIDGMKVYDGTLTAKEIRKNYDANRAYYNNLTVPD